MNQALSQFNSNIASVQGLALLYDTVLHLTPTLQDKMDDMLRAEIVLAVSAFDCYIHDLIRFGMLEKFGNATSLPNAYQNFNISLNAVHDILNTYDYSEKMMRLDSEIRRINGYKSFQESKNVTQGLSVLGITDLWLLVAKNQYPTETAKEWNTKKEAIKTRLDNIVKRRNQIAHEADLNTLGDKNPVDRIDTTDDINFIISLCESIHCVCNVA